jgi:hypothetical protein
VLSDQTGRNLADAFRRAAAATLIRSAGDVCDVQAAAKGADSQLQTQSPLLLITISSFVFRLVTVFQISGSEATRQYYCESGAATASEEAFTEAVNLCCGALSRELSAQFKHLAMSIPYRLESSCLNFLGELKAGLTTSYDITINDSARMRATLCMSASRPIELSAPAPEVSHTGGALEMF